MADDTHTNDAGWHVIPPDGGTSIAAFGSTVRFQLGGRDTGATFAIGLATTPPGVSPPLHVHDSDDELFIIAAGEMSFYTPEGWKDVTPGTVVSHKNTATESSGLRRRDSVLDRMRQSRPCDCSSASRSSA